MRIFGFLFRLLLVVALVVWLADRPGTAQIVWRDYVIDTSAAVLAVMVLAIAYAAVLLHRVWRLIWDGPRFWKLGRKIGKLQDGQNEMALGFAALASGQAADAGRHALKARNLLGENPVTRLIQAQAAQLAGDYAAAKSLYEAMTADSATAALGYRGLIMAALRDGRFDEAALAVHRFEQTKQDVPWLHLVRFELGARLMDWGAAEDALAKARKGKALPPAQANRQEAALLLAKGERALRDRLPREALAAAERARKLAPEWLPAALILAEAQLLTGHERAALRTIERMWALEPHPELAALALRSSRAARPIDGFRLLEKMSRAAAEKPAALMALAEAALRADLWGEARHALMSLVNKGRASRKTYQILAQLERREAGSESLAASWLLKAVNAPADSQWLCASCGASHETWLASCPSCGAFNRIAWEAPGQSRAFSRDAAKTEMLDFLR